MYKLLILIIFNIFILDIFSMNNVINKQFLPQSGSTLSGKIVSLPKFFDSRITLVAYGFSRKCQFDFDSWLIPFKKRYELNDNVFFFEIPMLGSKYKWGRYFIEKGMRSGIDPELHDNIMSYYEDTRLYKDFYGFSDKNVGYFLLLDSSSKIIWQAFGQANEFKLTQFYSIVDAELKKRNLKNE